VKGYLQRMATSAINPARTIQPVLATVYAPPRAEAEAAPGEWPESPTTIAQHPQTFRNAPDSDLHRPKAPIAETILNATRESAAADRKDSPDSVAFEPLVHTPANPPAYAPLEKPSAAREPQGNPIRPIQMETEPIAETIPNATRVSAVGNRKEFPDPMAFEPLVYVPANPPANAPLRQPSVARESQGNPLWPEQITTEPQTEPQVRVKTHRLALPISQPVDRRETLVDPLRGQRSPRKEMDEVHIHIGRIEVTAAPPSAPSAIPKPVRRAPNLDEYLRRHR